MKALIDNNNNFDNLCKKYFMKLECSIIKEKLFCVLDVISLFTAKYLKKKKKKSEHLVRKLIR